MIPVWVCQRLQSEICKKYSWLPEDKFFSDSKIHFYLQVDILGVFRNILTALKELV